MASSAPALNANNILNILGFIVNIISVGFGPSFFGLPDNAELSRKYQTIITPAGWAFAIWGVIFISQGVFSVAQLFPSYRARSLIQKGVNCYYFAACIFQVIWTFLFAFEYLFSSFVAMFAILVSLVLLVSSQYTPEVNVETSVLEYLLMRFPFEIHCGWIIAATAVNFSVIFVSPFNASANTQLAVAVVSLVILLGVTVFVLFRPSPPIYVIAVVMAWATLGIWSELGAADDNIQERFGDKVITIIRTSSIVVSAIGIILSIIRFVMVRTQKHKVEGGEGAYLNADVSGTTVRRF